MSGNTIQLRPKAEEDLEGIYLYSQKEWGISRAVTYIRDINAAFEVLANNAALGRNYNDVRPNLRAYNVASHVVLYKPINRGIAVIRVLHKSMDSKRHI